MTRPSPGLMAFHNSEPFEFLHVLDGDPAEDATGVETWQVRPLFIEHPVDRLHVFRRGDRLTPLHTQFR
jgi:hypothetical protein